MSRERVYPYLIEEVSSKRLLVPRLANGGGVVSVRVDLPLCRRGLFGPSQERGARQKNALWEEAKELAFDKFLLFLQIVAECRSSFPGDVLRRSREGRFFVLVSPQVEADLQARREPPQTIRLEEFDLTVLSHRRLEGGPAYLVERNKYCLYLYLQELPDEVRIFRSEFFELSTTVPPVAFRPEMLLSRLPFPWKASAERNFSPRQASCPRCHGRLVYLAPEEAFCLSCDWDNLKTLPPSDDFP